MKLFQWHGAAVVAILGLALGQGAWAARQMPAKSPVTAKSDEVPVKAARLTKQQRRWVEQAQAVVNSFDTTEEQILGDIRIAAVVCRRDPQQTDDLLHTAYQNLIRKKEGEQAAAGPAQNSKPRRDPLAWSISNGLRLASGKCDPAFRIWMERHRADQSDAYQSASELAGQQIKAGKTAEAEQTLKSAIRHGDFTEAKQNFWQEAEDLLASLQALRQKSPKAADALYLLELQKVQASPELLSVAGLGVLGAYPFASRPGRTSSPVPTTFMASTASESAMMPVLKTLQPAMDPSVADSYVRLVIAMLGSASLDASQINDANVLVNELIPVVAAWLPAESSALSLVAQELKMRTPASQSASNAQAKKPEGAKATQDGLLVLMTFGDCQQNKIDQAEATARKIKDPKIHAWLDPLVQFARARAAMVSGDIGTAEQITGQLPMDRMRVLMLCGLTAAYEREKDVASARAELAVAENAAGQLSVLDRAPVDAQIERLLARLDPEGAGSFLPTLTGDLNALDAELALKPRPGGTPIAVAWRKSLLQHRVLKRPIDWSPQFAIGTIYLNFYPALPGVRPVSFGDIPGLLYLSGDDAFAWLAGVNNDVRKLQILPGMLAYLLRPPQPAAAPKRAPAVRAAEK